MNHDDNQDRECEVRQRIAGLMHGAGQAPKKLSEEELQKLKTAAARLDQILKNAAEADRQALRDAAARLDRMLANIGARKNVATDLKQRRDRHGGNE